MLRRRVLVTGTGGRSVGAGILHALTRSPTSGCDARWEVVAADADPYAFGLYKSPLRAILPLASAPEYLQAVRDVCKRHDIVAILPGTEAETALLAREAAQLLPVRVITNRANLMPLMLDKSLLSSRLASAGVDTPATAPARGWEEFLLRHPPPIVLKPATGSGGSRGLRLLFREEDVRDAVDALGDSAGRYLLQEYVESMDTEFTVGVLCDHDGRIIDSIVIQRKLIGLSLLDRVVHTGREYAISTGYSQGFIMQNDCVRAACETVAKHLGSAGPLNLQLRVDGKRIVVFEVHPRFSGTTPIRADAGFNEPDVLLRNYLDGETFGRLGFRTNLVAIRALEHELVPFEAYEQLGGVIPRG